MIQQRVSILARTLLAGPEGCVLAGVAAWITSARAMRAPKPSGRFAQRSRRILRLAANRASRSTSRAAVVGIANPATASKDTTGNAGLDFWSPDGVGACGASPACCVRRPFWRSSEFVRPRKNRSASSQINRRRINWSYTKIAPGPILQTMTQLLGHFLTETAADTGTEPRRHIKLSFSISRNLTHLVSIWPNRALLAPLQSGVSLIACICQYISSRYVC